MFWAYGLWIFWIFWIFWKLKKMKKSKKIQRKIEKSHFSLVLPLENWYNMRVRFCKERTP